MAPTGKICGNMSYPYSKRLATTKFHSRHNVRTLVCSGRRNRLLHQQQPEIIVVKGDSATCSKNRRNPVDKTQQTEASVCPLFFEVGGIGKGSRRGGGIFSLLGREEELCESDVEGCRSRFALSGRDDTGVDLDSPEIESFLCSCCCWCCSVCSWIAW